MATHNTTSLPLALNLHHKNTNNQRDKSFHLNNTVL